MSLTLPTVTGYSGFWQLTGGINGVNAGPYAMTPQANGGGRSPIESKLARLFARNQLRELVAAMIALNGAAAGGTATSTYKRTQAPSGPSGATPAVTQIGDFGGNVNIETVTVIDRATTAADEAYIDDILDGDLLERTISYPTVLGSGGGGKLVNGVPSF